eukprot:GEMP01071281.1.p1 GENE.GEMP01071281.1~~GEMP01071281.1.p1  ORF type:complete len:216 (+),score=46.96 GEMP01071281.1:148-795(+)
MAAQLVLAQCAALAQPLQVVFKPIIEYGITVLDSFGVVIVTWVDEHGNSVPAPVPVPARIISEEYDVANTSLSGYVVLLGCICASVAAVVLASSFAIKKSCDVRCSKSIASPPTLKLQTNKTVTWRNGLDDVSEITEFDFLADPTTSSIASVDSEYEYESEYVDDEEPGPTGMYSLPSLSQYWRNSRLTVVTGLSFLLYRKSGGGIEDGGSSEVA